MVPSFCSPRSPNRTALRNPDRRWNCCMPRVLHRRAVEFVGQFASGRQTIQDGRVRCTHESRNPEMPWTDSPRLVDESTLFHVGQQLLEAVRPKNQCLDDHAFSQASQPTIKHSCVLGRGTADAPSRYSGATKRKDGARFRRRIGVHEPRPESRCRNVHGSGLLPDGSSSFGCPNTTRCGSTWVAI